MASSRLLELVYSNTLDFTTQRARGSAEAAPTPRQLTTNHMNFLRRGSGGV